MGITCQILINKTREGVYKAGDAVTGSVKYAVDEPTEYKDVKLSFLGKGKCSWSEEDFNKSSTNYSGTEDYIVQHVNVTNKRSNEFVTLHGIYEHPFEFYIPENVPTTFKDNTGSIVYMIRLKFYKSQLFSFNKEYTAEIPVYGPVELFNVDGQPTSEGPIMFGLEKSIFALLATKKPLIKLKGEIAKSRLTPGENAHISCTITNHSNVDVTGVKAELYCYLTYTADCGRTYKNNKKIKNCEAKMPDVPAGEIRNYSCVVPSLPECYSIQNSKVISREYKVRVTVRLPVPHVNASVEVTVAIGERKGQDIDSCVEALEDKPPQPPSYWEAMSEDKTVK